VAWLCRGALGILGDAPRGLSEAFMLAHRFTPETIASLVRDGLTTMRPETMRAGGPTIEVIRVKITDAGLRALEG
jgi:hypothetical protein